MIHIHPHARTVSSMTCGVVKCNVSAKVPAQHHDRWITCKLCSNTFHIYCVSYYSLPQDQYTCACCCKSTHKWKHKLFSLSFFSNHCMQNVIVRHVLIVIAASEFCLRLHDCIGCLICIKMIKIVLEDCYDTTTRCQLKANSVCWQWPVHIINVSCIIFYMRLWASPSNIRFLLCACLQ